MTIFKTATILVALAATASLAGCFTPLGSADVYGVDQAQREQTVRMGVVESVRAVRIAGDSGGSELGTLGGGALGAVAGSAIGGGRGSVLTAIAGGLLGAVAGNAAGQGMSSASGVEITVRLDNGELRAITQAATGEVFRAGDRIRILSSGGVTRVTH
ncbi:glycine zipper 2TM domain-containing protein [Burkholderia latens]|uniref:Glycine zipper 2TM domain-containing protein n=1 Tax=Burkholderia latens TaxID=488446 RepID=A0A6H9SU03_9BURK|nr:glycine zipper 2TM domain-containing protein [Burkholderia latens]KAB0644789.1 glycine zipper 2TM domain-containing protein [Burkholderia latens]VWB17464.1 membrane protein [Burkholderia latens]